MTDDDFNNKFMRGRGAVSPTPRSRVFGTTVPPLLGVVLPATDFLTTRG